MNEIKHTPGPWEVRPSSNPRNGTEWRDIVSIGTGFPGSYVGEVWGNDAALIAQAPDILAERDRLRQVNAELVAALETIANSTCDHGPGFCARDSARAALAKAKGE